MERKKNLKYYSYTFLVVIFCVGIVGHLIESLKSTMLFLTPITLLVTGCVVLFNIYNLESKKLLYWFLTTYIITFSIEVIGVETKLIFGNYSYGSVLGLQILGVPLIIGFNWVLVILGAISSASRVIEKKKYLPLAAALIALVFDFILEPVAIKLGYWNWIGNTIPIRNYLAWFIIAFIFSLFYLRMRVVINSDLPMFYLLIQFVFFITILLFL